VFDWNNRPASPPNYPPYYPPAGAGMSGRPSGIATIARSVNWPLFAGFLAVIVVTLYSTRLTAFVGWGTFAFVLVGWLFSLTLHEFSHAAVAFLSGDRSPTTRRYLSGNPLHYINPFLSIVLPLLFLLIGGIGLPGGAVYLQRGLIRDRWRQSAISLAGPAANFVVLVVLTVVYHLGLSLGFLDLNAAAAIGFLAFLQVTAILLNLLPVPGLDGYGVIEPYLSYQTRQAFEVIRPYGFILIFVLFFWVPVFSQLFFGVVFQLLGLTGIDPVVAFNLGFANFEFWRH
jgi:Zn-dependent protease